MSRSRGAGIKTKLTGGIVAMAAAAALGAPPASASRDQPTIFDAGFTLLAEGPGQRANDLREMNGAGVDTVRIVVPWRTIAPNPDSPVRPQHFDAADPDDYPPSSAATVDQIVRGADALGMGVLLTPSSPFPDWASRSGRSEIGDPIPGEYHDFVEMLGRRYSGRYTPATDPPDRCPEILCPAAGDQIPLPRVSAWSLWNEPNLDVFLQPQFKGKRPYSPTLYRRLFLAGHSGLADSGHRSDEIDIGETATTGGRSSINPLDFVRGVLCMDRHFGPSGNCRPIQATAWAQHPYGYAVAPYLKPANPHMVNIAELSRLSDVLARAYELGKTSRSLPITITEFGVLTNPSDIGVSPLRQVTEMAASEFLAWRDPLVDSFAQYLLRDDSPKNKLIFTSGLRYADNSPKPLRRAFPMTLLVRRAGPGYVRVWGHVRPASAVATVSVFTRTHHRGRRLLRRIRTDSYGYFGFESRFRPGLRWQAVGKLAGGRKLKGPFLPAIRFPLPPRK